MATPVVTLHKNDQDADGNNNPFVSVARTPTANTTQLVMVTTRGSSSHRPAVVSDGGSLTWTEIVEIQHDTGGTLSYMAIWRAETGASPGSETITITCPANPGGILYHWVEVENLDLTTDNGLVQYATNLNASGAGTITSTFGATPATDAVIVSFCSIQESNNTTFTEDTGFTELSKIDPSSNEQSAVQYQIGSSPGTGVTGAWASQSGPIGIISLELAAEDGGGGASDITPGAVTVTATPGTVSLATTYPVSLTGATVTVTPASVALTTGSVAVTPDPITVTATPGTVVVTSLNPVVPDPITVTVTPSATVLTTGPTAIVPDPVTVTATPGTLSANIAQFITVSDVTVTVTPGTQTVTTGSVGLVPAAVTVTVTPGIASFSLTSEQSVSLTGASIAVTAGTTTTIQTHLFTPGTTGQAILGAENHSTRVPQHDSMWRLYGTPVGVGYSVIITGGVVTPAPGRIGASVDDLAGADSGSGDNGLSVFTRGATYSISEAEKDILVAAGYSMS